MPDNIRHQCASALTSALGIPIVSLSAREAASCDSVYDCLSRTVDKNQNVLMPLGKRQGSSPAGDGMFHVRARKDDSSVRALPAADISKKTASRKHVVPPSTNVRFHPPCLYSLFLSIVPNRMTKSNGLLQMRRCARAVCRRFFVFPTPPQTKKAETLTRASARATYTPTRAHTHTHTCIARAPKRKRARTRNPIARLSRLQG